MIVSVDGGVRFDLPPMWRALEIKEVWNLAIISKLGQLIALFLESVDLLFVQVIITVLHPIEKSSNHLIDFNSDGSCIPYRDALTDVIHGFVVILSECIRVDVVYHAFVIFLVVIIEIIVTDVAG